MNILVACEFSGIVTKAFRDKGNQVVSCDLLASEIEGEHYKGDVLDILYDGWDMLIGFPPCTFLSYAGTAYWNRKGRIKKRIEALEFFRKLWESPIEKICLENPMGIASKVITNHHQIIHPYYFGDDAQKRTCLWLKNLPKLVYYKENDLFSNKTMIDKPKPIYIDKSGKHRSRTEALSSRQRKERSRFWKGIAEAMAEQWNETIL